MRNWSSPSLPPKPATEMRFLADENCHEAVIKAYRDAGHDVLSIKDTRPGTPDMEVLSESVESGRILLTEDKDFGELIFAAGQRTCEVILFRLPGVSRQAIVQRALDLLESHADRLENGFVVVEPNRIRFATMIV